MTNRPSNRPSLDELRTAAEQEANAARNQASRQIESRAGRALTRSYWREKVWTPLGRISRRGAVVLLLSMLLSCSLIAGATAISIQNSLPSVQLLPRGDASTVMSHVYANFSATNKDPNFAPYFPPSQEIWRFNDAQAFNWRGEGGAEYTAVVMSYPDLQQLNQDYFNHLRFLQFPDSPIALSVNNDIAAESRSSAEYGAPWVSLRASNLLLLVSANASPAEQQELFSHFISITAADHRDYIPSPTP